MPKFAGVVEIDERAVDKLLNAPAGPTGKFLSRLGLQVYSVARNMAPVSPKGSHGRPPGYLKTHIEWELHSGAEGLYVTVVSPATTGDRRDFAYGAAQNVENLRGAHGGRIRTTPHLEPALRYVFNLY